MLSFRCVHPDTTPRKNGRWVFVFSTTSLLPPGTRNRSIRRSRKSRLSIGTCITATGHKEFFTTIRRFTFFRRTSIRGIRALVRVVRRAPVVVLVSLSIFRCVRPHRLSNRSAALKLHWRRCQEDLVLI